MKRLLTALLLCLVSSLALGAVNLNTATREELIALPGIGPVKAQAIIDYRNANGPFRSIEDVMKVKGIKEGEFGKIRNDVSVSGRTTVPEAVTRTAPSARPTASAPVSPSIRNPAATTGAAATGATAPGAKAETPAPTKQQAREERAARRAAAKAAKEQKASETKAAKEQKASEARTTADASATTAGTSTKATRKKSKRPHADDDRDKAASDKGAAAGAK